MIRCMPVALLLSLASACGAVEEADCLATTRQPILGGDARAPLAGTQAIVRIDVLERGGVVDVCSGAFVARHWILTARHCVTSRQAAALRIVTGAGAHLPRCAPSPGQPVLEIRTHPELDLALLRVSFDHTDPLPTATLADERAFIAGYGVDESDAPGALRFAQVLVDEVDAGFAWVHAAGAGGACFGDSGGPLLIDRDGDAALVGVLNIGSGDCLGRDRYGLIEPAADWVNAGSSE